MKAKRKTRRIFNRQSGYVMVMAFMAAGLLFRMLRPYWQTPGEETPKTQPEGPVVSVVRVVDGDTIKVRYFGKVESVRLLRINTPERGRPGYKEATLKLKGSIERTVRLEFERPDVVHRDKYDRLLAYVISNGKNVNVEMVEAGWSRFWVKYGEGRFAKEFKKAENEARLAERGLWTDLGWGMTH